MARFALLASLLAFVLFNYGQYRGWDLFADDAGARPTRSASGYNSSGYRSSGSYHK